MSKKIAGYIVLGREYGGDDYHPLEWIKKQKCFGTPCMNKVSTIFQTRNEARKAIATDIKGNPPEEQLDLTIMPLYPWVNVPKQKKESSKDLPGQQKLPFEKEKK